MFDRVEAKRQGWSSVSQNLGQNVLASFLFFLIAYVTSLLNRLGDSQANRSWIESELPIKIRAQESADFGEIITWFVSTNQVLGHSIFDFVVTLIAVALGLLIIRPLWIGYNRRIMDNLESNQAGGEIFSVFSGGKYIGTLKGSTWQWLWEIIWVAAMLVPMFFGLFIIIAATVMKINSQSSATAMVILGSVMLLVSLVGGLVVNINRGIAYMFTTFILAEDPSVGARAALNQSKELTKGIRMDLFVLKLSFLGWRILAVLTCGILDLGVTPYIQATEAIIFKKLRDDKARVKQLYGFN